MCRSLFALLTYGEVIYPWDGYSCSFFFYRSFFLLSILLVSCLKLIEQNQCWMYINNLQSSKWANAVLFGSVLSCNTPVVVVCCSWLILFNECTMPCKSFQPHIKVIMFVWIITNTSIFPVSFFYYQPMCF